MRRSDLVQLLAVRPDDEVLVAIGSRRFVVRGIATDRATGDIILLTQSTPHGQPEPGALAGDRPCRAAAQRAGTAARLERRHGWSLPPPARRLSLHHPITAQEGTPMSDPVITGILADLAAAVEEKIDETSPTLWPGSTEHQGACILEEGDEGRCTGQHYLDTLEDGIDEPSFTVTTAEGRMFTITVTEVTK